MPQTVIVAVAVVISVPNEIARDMLSYCMSATDWRDSLIVYIDKETVVRCAVTFRTFNFHFLSTAASGGR